MKKLIACLILATLLLASCADITSDVSKDTSVAVSGETSKSDYDDESEEQSEPEESIDIDKQLLTTIKIGGESIDFYYSHYNREITSDGVYMYDADYSGERTVGTDVVILNNMIVYIAEDDTAMIPNAGGIVLTFYNVETGDIKVGDSVVTKYDTKGISGEYICIAGYNYPVSFSNAIRTPEGVTTYYDREYGEKTGTNPYGVDIEVQDGKVININRSGNSTIPQNGYVLSLHMDAKCYKQALSKIRVGDEASPLMKPAYYVEDQYLTSIGGVRKEDALVLYTSGKTGTNQYGYEIIVQNGVMIDASPAGNATVPTGGYVLSGHGVNADKLRDRYEYGAGVIININEQKVSWIYTPYDFLTEAENLIDTLIGKIQTAKDSLLDLDYAAIAAALEEIEAKYAYATECFDDRDYDTALSEIALVNENVKQVEYMLYEQAPVSNNAVWHRSSAKSDEEVEAEIQQIVALGFNIIYLETWYDGRFIGFADNELISHHTDKNGNYDLLRGYVTIAHEYGVELHAWVQNFFIGTVEPQEQTDLNLANHFRDSWLKDKSGRENYYYSVTDCNFIFIDPSNEEYADLLSELYNQIITDYGVDGIQLDYIRFPEKNGANDFGYNDSIVSAWQAQQNTKANPQTLAAGSILYQSWIKYRQDLITAFVSRIYNESKAANPDAVISAAVYPGIPDIKNDIFQDCEAWVKAGIIDCLVSMSYGDDYSYVSDNIQKFVTLTKGKCLYIPGISAFTSTANSVLAQQIDTAYDKTGGVGVFSTYYINGSGYSGVIKHLLYNGAVQTYKYGATVSTYIEWVKRKANGVYSQYGGLVVTDGIGKLMDELIADGAEFGDGKGKSAKERQDYLADAIAELEGLLTEVRKLSSCDGRDALIKDLTALQAILQPQL